MYCMFLFQFAHMGRQVFGKEHVNLSCRKGICSVRPFIILFETARDECVATYSIACKHLAKAL
jgi:hypothetical protein